MKRLIAGVVLVVGLLLALWAFWWEPRSLISRSEALTLTCWKGQPIRIALISDLHVGAPYIDQAKLQRVVKLANEGHPDLVVLLGDYIVQGVVGGRVIPPEAIAPTLGGLHAPLGVFAVLGNHDWWLNAPRVASALRAAGINVIDDSAVTLGGPQQRFWLVGVSDFREGRHDLRGALSHVTGGAPVIVITHNPDLFPQVPARVCLTLAGHTHGGQVAFPLLGRLIVPSRYGQRYAIGHITEGGRDLYVTAGVGTSIIPVRFRVPPEIVFLDVRGDKN